MNEATETIIRRSGRYLWANAQGKPIVWFTDVVRETVKKVLQEELGDLHEGVVKARKALEGQS